MTVSSDVVRPSWAWFALLDGGLVALSLLACSETAHQRAVEVSPVPIPSQPWCRSILFGAVIVHIAEGVAAGSMARRRGVSPKGWRLQSLIVGFPSLRLLRALPRVAPVGGVS